jgi:anti-anti-sigma factor
MRTTTALTHAIAAPQSSPRNGRYQSLTSYDGSRDVLPHSYSVTYLDGDYRADDRSDAAAADARDPSPRCAEFHLRCSPRQARLQCSGELDHVEGRRLEAILARLERLPTPVTVSLRDVSFCDSHGVAPLFEASRRRAAHELPPLRIVEVSAPVARILDLLGVRSVDPPDLVGWDAAGLSGLPSGVGAR